MNEMQPPQQKMDLLKKILTFNCWFDFTTEAKFTTWFGSCIKERWGFFFKISDQDQRIKPFDAMFCFNWFTWFIEFKLVKTKSRKPYMLLKGSSPSNSWWQVKWLWEVINNWWFGLVIVYNNINKQYTIYNFADIYPELKDYV